MADAALGCTSSIPLLDSLSSARPVVVLGAAGSGKTTLLTDYVVRLVNDQGVHPDQVRILTPTRQQATQLRDVVGVRVSTPTRGPLVMSIQAFAFDLVRFDRERRGDPPPRLRSGADVDQDIAQLLEEHIESGGGPQWPPHLSAQVRSTETLRTELRELMARLTELNLGAEDLRGWSTVHSAWPAVADFIDEYQRVIARSRPDEFDSAELLRLATELVTHGVASARGYRTIVIDNAHDMSPATTGLLMALHDAGVHVVVCAEPDVAGQTFRGADAEGPSHLARAWGIEPVVLPHVYRHGPAIRSLVGEVTSRVGTALAGSQRAARSQMSDAARPVLCVESPSPTREAHDIARLMRARHRDEGIAFSDMAVVVRRSGAIPVMASALKQAGVPTDTDYRTSIGQHPATRELIGWIQLARDPQSVSTERIGDLLAGVYGGLQRRELRRLGHLLRRLDQVEGISRSPKESLASMMRDAELHPGLPEHWQRPLGRVLGVIDALRALAESTTADVLASEAWRLWNVEDEWVARATHPERPSSFARESINQVGALLRTAERFIRSHMGVSALAFFDRVLNADVTEDVLMPSVERRGVTVATPAQVAGQEFEVVAIAGVNEHVWPNTRIRGSLLGSPLVMRAVRGQLSDSVDEQRVVIDDELRMAALSISRARQAVIISCVHSDDEQPSALFHLLAKHSEREPTSSEETGSLLHLVASARRTLCADPADADAAATLAQLASMGVRGADPDQWWGVLPSSSDEPLFAQRDVPISPSKLKAVEDSALDWFLDRIAPEDLPPAVGVGSLLHYALEHAPWGTAEELTELVSTRFSELDFEAGWQANAQHRQALGYVVALAEYLRDRQSLGATVESIEQRFEIPLDGAIIVGIIDRIERNAEGQLVVVDLKTGQPVTDNKVVDDPQLSAYQLAVRDASLGESFDGPGDVAGAWLLFVKEGKDGKRYRIAAQEALGPEELERFTARVLEAAGQMASGSFEGPREKRRAGNGPLEHRWQRVGAVCGD